MSLDFSLQEMQPVNLFSSNITHNLNKMAKEAGIYEELWGYIGDKRAKEFIAPLGRALSKLKADPDHYKTFNSPNGWGTYDNFVKFLEDTLDACKEYPDNLVAISV